MDNWRKMETLAMKMETKHMENPSTYSSHEPRTALY